MAFIQPRDAGSEVQPNFEKVLAEAAEFDFPLETYSETDWNFEGEIYDCVYSKDFERLIRGMEVEEQSILSHRGEVQIDFSIRQAVLAAGSDAAAASLIEIIELAARDCSEPSERAEVEYGGYVYKNYRTVSDEFGLALEGGVIDMESSICLDGCKPSGQYKLVAARKGSNVLLLSYGYTQNEPYEKVEYAKRKMLRYSDFVDHIQSILGRFNGTVQGF
jgi:hypothetical protein